jgi:hypothetical protein
MPAFPRVAIGIVTLAWLTSFFIPIGFVTLVVRLDWFWLVVGVLCIAICSFIQFPSNDRIRTCLLDGIADAVGGVRIVYKQKRADERNILYAIHPHGLTSTLPGFVLSDIQRRTGQKVGLVVAPLLRWINPLMRLLMGIMGIDLVSSSKSCVQREMRNGGPIGIVVGGFEEMLRTTKHRDVVYLKNRKGFLKQAVRNGYTVVPIYCFGESQIYSNRLKLRTGLRDWCAKWKVPATVPVGAGGVSFMPLRLSSGALIVVGEPMRWNKSQVESCEGLDKVHAQYVTAVKQLYSAHNPFKGRKLDIV